jgi:hypothetical protein
LEQRSQPEPRRRVAIETLLASKKFLLVAYR